MRQAGKERGTGRRVAASPERLADRRAVVGQHPWRQGYRRPPSPLGAKVRVDKGRVARSA